jgi:hypothetical protein
MFRAIMALLGVDIPPLEGVVQLRFLMTKKCTLEMMECVEEFWTVKSSKVVQQSTDKVKIARMAKVKEIMEAAAAAAAQWKRLEEEEEEQQEQQEEQAPKKRGKQKTFDDRMEDLKRYKETHGHINVSISKEKNPLPILRQCEARA